MSSVTVGKAVKYTAGGIIIAGAVAVAVHHGSQYFQQEATGLLVPESELLIPEPEIITPTPEVIVDPTK